MKSKALPMLCSLWGLQGRICPLSFSSPWNPWLVASSTLFEAKSKASLNLSLTLTSGLPLTRALGIPLG